MKIIYIHGANASPLSFNYIKEKLPKHVSYMVKYSVAQPLKDTIDSIAEIIEKCDEKVSIISHSLGGVIAFCLANRYPNLVEKVVTMSTPFGGSMVAEMLKWVYPQHQLFHDVATNSNIIRSLEKPIQDVLCFATVGGGIPLMKEPNDGVVTVSSQKKFDNIDYKEVETNHFEVLLNTDVINTIERFLWN